MLTERKLLAEKCVGQADLDN